MLLSVSYVIVDSDTNPSIVNDITSISQTVDSNIYPTLMHDIIGISSTVDSNIQPTSVQDIASMSSQHWTITSSLNTSAPALPNENSTTESML